MESWSSRVPSSSGVNAVGSVGLSLSDIYLIFDVNACSVKGFGVCSLPQDMTFIVSDFAEFARRESRRTCAAHVQNRDSQTALLIFHQCNFLWCQTVELVHECVDFTFQNSRVRLRIFLFSRKDFIDKRNDWTLLQHRD